ncbi:transmembrane protein 79-like [Asterias rubens]|uniref:transmembrane protein 79-like n=1 Tax=Asterias rubens TaxID=7604 RepID=UPI0014557C9D|nr:transmembrane protein 79-like [Asterias rubens]XP_033645742.1 transmembrane protein 79-like [Asterias rubens]XP_033645743.1 transmembrane protein 79-like [Asterias rubens]
MTSKDKADLQAEVVRRVFIAGIFLVAMTYILWQYDLFDVTFDPTLTNRLAFTLRWLVLSLLPTVVGVQLVGNIRYTNMDTAGVQTTSKHAEELVRLNQRALQNTLEQTSVHVAVTLVLSTHLDPSHLKIIPILICMFVTARAIFYIGYLTVGDHFGRAFGYALTMWVNMSSLMYCTYCLVVYGASYGLTVE